MVKRFRNTTWLLGVVVLGVHSFATPPEKTKELTRTGRLVTGDASRISSVVAGVGTLKFYFTPVPPLSGTDPSLAYPAGFSIVGQILTVSEGGFTSAWNIQMSDWDPDQNGNPLLRSFQAKVAASGFLGANASPPNPGCNLVYPAQNFTCAKHCSGGPHNGDVCSNAATCQGGSCVDPCSAMLGEPGPKCGGTIAGVCDWGWQNTCGSDGSCAPPKRADWVFAGDASGDQIPVAAIISPSGPNFAGTTNPGAEIFDSGIRAYIGTLLLPVPECARGTYTMPFIANETFAQDEAQPANDIPVAQLVAGQLVIPVGSCCANLGANGTCTADQTNSQCDELANGTPHAWRAGVGCEVACPACAQEPCPIGITTTNPPVCTIDARFPNDPSNAATRFGFDSIVLTFSSDPGVVTAASFQMSTVPSQAGVPIISNVQKNGNQVTLTFDRKIPSTRWTCVKALFGEQDTACIGALGADTDASRLSDTPDTIALIDALDGNPTLQIWQTDLDRSGTFTPIDLLASLDLLNGAGALNAFRNLTLQACPTVGIP